MKCPQCNRQFSTNAALAQHKRDAHSRGGQPIRAATARRAAAPQTVGGPSMTRIVSSGVDLLGSVSCKAKMQVGTGLLSQQISPIHLPDSRLRMEAGLWARWRPKKLVCCVVASGASTVYGSIVIGWTPEDNWVPTRSQSDLVRVSTFRPGVAIRLNETKRFNIPIESLTKWYLTNGEVGLSTHGIVVAVVAANLGGYDGAVTVNVTLEWTVEFEGAEMPTETSGHDTIMPDAGWSNLFTTSDGSFDATRLTFKMHSGGDMVPFSSARADRVYTPDDGTTVYYVDETGKTQNCKWFAKVVNYAVPGLLCFGSEKDASEYISSGDPAKALVYKSASGYAKPAKPRFVGRDPAATKVGAFNSLLRNHPDLFGLPQMMSLLSVLGIEACASVQHSEAESLEGSRSARSAGDEAPADRDDAGPSGLFAPSFDANPRPGSVNGTNADFP